MDFLLEPEWGGVRILWSEELDRESLPFRQLDSKLHALRGAERVRLRRYSISVELAAHVQYPEAAATEIQQILWDLFPESTASLEPTDNWDG